VDESQIDSRRWPFLNWCVEFGQVDTRADGRVAMGGASDERYDMLVSVSTCRTCTGNATAPVNCRRLSKRRNVAVANYAWGRSTRWGRAW
jgi:hypothetical protein